MIMSRGRIIMKAMLILDRLQDKHLRNRCYVDGNHDVSCAICAWMDLSPCASFLSLRLMDLWKQLTHDYDIYCDFHVILMSRTHCFIIGLTIFMK